MVVDTIYLSKSMNDATNEVVFFEIDRVITSSVTQLTKCLSVER